MSTRGEHDRQIGNGVLIGTVKELDESNALVRVDVDGMVTDWLQFSASRAGPGVREWAPPEVGEQVVLAAPYGDLSQAVVIGSVYQDAHAAPGAKKTAPRVQYGDGAFIEYDREAHAYTIDVPSSGSVLIRVGGSTLKVENGQTTLTTPKLIVAGDLEVTGAAKISGATTLAAVTSNGKNVGSTHTHSNNGAGPPN